MNQALIQDRRNPKLSLLAASQTKDKEALTKEGVTRVIRELQESFEYVICDSPAGIESGEFPALPCRACLSVDRAACRCWRLLVRRIYAHTFLSFVLCSCSPLVWVDYQIIVCSRIASELLALAERSRGRP